MRTNLESRLLQETVFFSFVPMAIAGISNPKKYECMCVVRERKWVFYVTHIDATNDEPEMKRK